MMNNATIDNTLQLNIINITEDDSYLPKYANESDACMDLKAYLPECSAIGILPGQTKLISTGIRVAVPENHVMMMFVRSSVGAKKNLCLANGTGIIDSGYRDEVIMALHNFGDSMQKVCDKDRVCQFMILPRPKVTLVEALNEEEFLQGDRGGGIGSTGVQ